MSHFATIETQIKDLDALLCACVELGVKLQPDFYCRGYAGVTRKAAYVIQLKGPYDIAVDPSPENDGNHTLTADWWDGHVAKEVGAGYCRLLQSYGAHKTVRLARQARYRATRTNEADGSILYVLEGGAL